MMKNIVLFNILMDLIVLFTMKIISDNDHRDAKQGNPKDEKVMNLKPGYKHDKEGCARWAKK